MTDFIILFISIWEQGSYKIRLYNQKIMYIFQWEDFYIVFDLFIYPFGFKKNDEYSNLSGYFVGNVHRKATRTRVEDIIVIRFTPFRKLTEEEDNHINQIRWHVFQTLTIKYKLKPVRGQKPAMIFLPAFDSWSVIAR